MPLKAYQKTCTSMPYFMVPKRDGFQDRRFRKAVVIGPKQTCTKSMSARPTAFESPSWPGLIWLVPAIHRTWVLAHETRIDLSDESRKVSVLPKIFSFRFT